MLLGVPSISMALKVSLSSPKDNMATYSIKTTRAQEIGLKFAYDNYADKEKYPTQAEYFQFRIDSQVTNPMYQDQQNAQSISFDQSFKTVPELQQPTARTEIEGVITSHGGTIIPPGPIKPPDIPPISLAGGVIPSTRGTSGNPIQVGGKAKTDAGPSGRDGGRDNEIEKSEPGLDESGKGSKGTPGD